MINIKNYAQQRLKLLRQFAMLVSAKFVCNGIMVRRLEKMLNILTQDLFFLPLSISPYHFQLS